MSLRQIVLWPDARLQTACAEVPQITAQVRALASDMLETMYAAPGRGLAAPQVGEMLRIFVMDVSWKEAAPDPQVFLNPVLERAGSDRQVQSEGCLSIPGVMVQVSRPAQVTLRWTDLDGAAQRGVFSGFAAACVQHEIDHLNGIVTLDHLEDEARTAAEARHRADVT